MKQGAEDKVSILLVDDVADNLSMLEAILERPDYCLVKAESGEEALDKINQQDFAVIMLDVMMPGMNGFDVAKAIRSSQRNAGTPIIFITAYAREKPSIEKGFSLGAADYLTKPIDVLQVRAKVDVFAELFKTNRLLRENRSEHYDRHFEEAFLEYVTYEIRAPLASILGFTRLLKDKRLSEDERQIFIDIIDRNGRELGKVVDDISDLSRLEAGHLNVALRPFPLFELLAEIRMALAAKAEENHVKVFVESRGTVPDSIVSDRARLRQILLNVMGNAIKFTHEGSVFVSVRFKEGVEPSARSKIIFTIRDTGRGMTPEQIKHLFQPFSPENSSGVRGFASSGLGLLLARQLARLLGGDVTLKESAVGVGSVFSIVIDAGVTSQLATGPVVSPQNATFTSKKAIADRSLQGISILVVDDVEDNCRLMERLLALRGAIVETAYNGKEAVKKALSRPYSVILMDIQMPVMDGYQATRELRSRGYHYPIIAFTAHSMEQDRERSLREGCDEHLVKPFDQDKFLATIRNFTQNYPH